MPRDNLELIAAARRRRTILRVLAAVASVALTPVYVAALVCLLFWGMAGHALIAAADECRAVLRGIESLIDYAKESP